MNNKRISIKNVGPIKDIDLDLNKVNVFMGEQSSGKSTIAKIISFFNWIEKDISIHQSFEKYVSDENFFIEKLESFHKMKGYFNSNSELIYISETLKINYKKEKINIEWIDRYNYKRSKISYIPSERSIVILPEMEKVELPNNYLKSFLFDWFDSRKLFNNDNKLQLLDIGIDFYFSEKNKENHLISNKNKYDILLSQSSSGLQSLTPLLIMCEHLIKHLYEEDQNTSYLIDEVKTKVSQELFNNIVLNPIYNYDQLDNKEKHKIIQNLTKNLLKDRAKNKIKEYFKVTDNLFKTHYTNLIIEEPEQNLFPATQKQLIYKLLNLINCELNHSLTITTHSPYILYAINNCILSFLTKEKRSIDKKNIFLETFINPKNISIYEIKDGKIKNIQDENGLIGSNFFDEQMKEVMDDFYVMLNYL
jgi:predicted ATPase